MVLFPNCKINIGLRILRKRNDGYHDLETVFYPLPIYDVLEILEQPYDQHSATLPFSVSGLDIEGSPASNICIKAYKLLKKYIPRLPHIIMHLHKTIPTGSGLGGGSADGAFTLLLLNKKFKLGLTEKQLEAYALELGSDCPFFIINKPCYATGRGERLEPISLDLSAYHMMIVNPGIHVNTSHAFHGIQPSVPEMSLEELINHPIEQWKELIHNDFEKTIFEEHPAIGRIRSQLYDAGALFASMSGTGSTVYGIFDKAIPDLDFPPHYYSRKLAGKR